MSSNRDIAILKWCAIAVSVAWIAIVGWSQLSQIRQPDGFRSDSYRKQAERCTGSYAKRYECKSSILINNDASAFNDWALRLVFVFLPPGLTALLYTTVRNRRERQEEEARERRAARQVARSRAKSEARQSAPPTAGPAEAGPAPRRPA